MWLLEHLTRSGQTFTDTVLMEGPVVVDREAGIIKDVKLLGLKSRNGRRYLESALSGGVSKYEGAKVNVNHPKGSPGSPRDYQDRLGVIRNVQYREGDGLYGDLHFNPKHGISEQLAWDAEHAPQNVGMSHNVHAKTKQDKGEMAVEAINRVTSVDLVADPATTDGLFEHEGSTLSEVIAAGKDSGSPLLPVLEAFVTANQQMGQSPVAMPQAMQQDGPQVNNQLLAGLKSAMNALIDDSSLSVDEVLNIIRKAVGTADPEEDPPVEDEDEDMFEDPEKKKKFEENVNAAVDAKLTPLTEQLSAITKDRDARAILESFNSSPTTVGPERFKELLESADEAAMKALVESWPPAVRGAKRPAAQGGGGAAKKSPRLIHARR